MDELIEQIKQHLTHFRSQTLCDGDQVRDALLDLLLKAQEIHSGGLVAPTIDDGPPIYAQTP